jgi:hypothetical protein
MRQIDPMSDDGLSVNGPKTVGQSLLVLLAGLAFLGFGAVDYVQATNAVGDSVEVEATITEVGVETVSNPAGSGATVKHEPTVAFTYTYDGGTYTSDDVFPGETPPRYEQESAARDVIEPYEPEMTTTAYVDPETPGQAFLENRTTGRQFVFMAVGAVGALFGGFFSVRNYRRDRA